MAVIEAPRVYASSGTNSFADWLTAPSNTAGLPNEAAGDMLAGLRHKLRSWLGAHPRCDDAIAVAEELLTNALAHGSRPGGLVTLLVRCLEEGRLEVCVGDEGRTASDAPCLSTPGLGRGLRIVEDLSERVIPTYRRTGGRSVRAVLAATAPPVIAPDVDDVEALIAAYADGDDDHDDGHDDAIGGGDRVC